MRRLVALACLVLSAGCSSPSGGTTAGARSTTAAGRPSSATPSSAAVADSATLRCGDAIDGGPPPDDFEVVLGAVALPTSSAGRALQAADSGDPGGPRLFAKTGLLVRAGTVAELTVTARPGDRIGIAWGNPGPDPGQRFSVPSCPDEYGTGWLAYPGGYWVDERLCLPLTVRAGGRERQVRIGIGTPCPGQAPPAD